MIPALVMADLMTLIANAIGTVMTSVGIMVFRGVMPGVINTQTVGSMARHLE